VCGNVTKGAAERKAGAPYKGEGAGRRKEVKESRGRKSSTHGQATRSAARIEEELSRRAKEESRGTLWKRCPGRGIIIRVRVDDRRGSSIVLDLQVQGKRVSCRRQPGAKDDPLMEMEGVELVWMQREDKGEGGMVQRGKGAARRPTVGKTGKRNKRGG